MYTEILAVILQKQIACASDYSEVGEAKYRLLNDLFNEVSAIISREQAEELKRLKGVSR